MTVNKDVSYFMTTDLFFLIFTIIFEKLILTSIFTSVGTSDPNFGSTRYFWPEIRVFLGQGLEELSNILVLGVKALLF